MNEKEEKQPIKKHIFSNIIIINSYVFSYNMNEKKEKTTHSESCFSV